MPMPHLWSRIATNLYVPFARAQCRKWLERPRTAFKSVWAAGVRLCQNCSRRNSRAPAAVNKIAAIAVHHTELVGSSG